MIKPANNLVSRAEVSSEKANNSSLQAASLSSIDESGQVYINLPTISEKPLLAKVALCASDRLYLTNNPETELLVLAPVSADSEPVILGLVMDKIELFPMSAKSIGDESLHIDVTSLVLEAQQELVLKCGKSKITLTANGEIVVRGTDVISRSSGTNRIRGATVRIN